MLAPPHDYKMIGACSDNVSVYLSVSLCVSVGHLK